MSSYLVLARKYRPAGFDDVVGQDHVVRTLKNSILSGRIAHAFLFCGVRGVGKTTVARILAKALNCLQRGEDQADPCNQCSSCREITDGVSVDVQEIDGASHTSVENIREINEGIKYPPAGAAYKVIIIDEVHMISINAFNALLKTLEEPPPHAKFIFATTESHKVPATINSRCQRFNFRTIGLRELIGGMSDILEKENIVASEEALGLVAREAQGSFRDALSLLDQIIGFSEGEITEASVKDILGLTGGEAFTRLADAVIARDAGEALQIVHRLFEQGADPDQVVMDIARRLRHLTVVKAVPAESRTDAMIDAPAADIVEMERIAEHASQAHLQNLFSMVLQAESQVKRAGNPWIALEMLVVQMASAPDIADVTELIQRMDRVQTGNRGPGPAPSPLPPRRKTPDRTTIPPRSKLEAEPSNSVQTSKKAQTPKEETVSEPPSPPPKKPTATERFVIDDVRPIGEPDEMWALVKKRLREAGVDPVLEGTLEHATLIALEPDVVELGLNNAFYQEQFQTRYDSNEKVRAVFTSVLGDVPIKTLVLAKPTSLDTKRPYEEPKDGETDRSRSLKQEAMDHPIVRAIQAEFDDSTIDDIRILS